MALVGPLVGFIRESLEAGGIELAA
jgi:hypothetical protein